MVVDVVWVGIREFTDSLARIALAADAAGEKIVTRGAHIVEAEAKALSPVRSGTLRRSIGLVDVMRVGAGRWQSQTAPTTVYARRIELGFHGADSLGRVYNNSPEPYMQPGLEVALPALGTLYDAEWAAALKA